MGRNISIDPAASSGGGTAPSAGTSFEGMPFIGSHGGVSSKGHIRAFLLAIKTLPSAYTTRDLAASLSYITPDNNTGANISTSTVGAWATIISTTGTQGKLFNVIPNVSATANSLLEIEVTIDGVIHTYSATMAGAGYTAVLGAVIMAGNLPATTATIDYLQMQALPSSYGDNGFYNITNSYIHILHPLRALADGFPYLQWTTDMQVRVRAAGAYLTHADAAASFMYD